MSERPRQYNPEILALQEEGNGFLSRMRDKLYLLAGRTVTTSIIRIVEVNTANGPVKLGVESQIVTPNTGNIPELLPGDRISRTEANILASRGYTNPYTAVVGAEQNGTGNTHRIATSRRPTPQELRFIGEHLPGNTRAHSMARNNGDAHRTVSSQRENMRQRQHGNIRSDFVPAPIINTSTTQPESPSLPADNTFSILDSITEHMTLDGQQNGPLTNSGQLIEEDATPSVPALPAMDSWFWNKESPTEHDSQPPSAMRLFDDEDERPAGWWLTDPPDLSFLSSDAPGWDNLFEVTAATAALAELNELLESAQSSAASGLPYPAQVDPELIAVVHEFQDRMPGPTPPEATAELEANVTQTNAQKTIYEVKAYIKELHDAGIRTTSAALNLWAEGVAELEDLTTIRERHESIKEMLAATGAAEVAALAKTESINLNEYREHLNQVRQLLQARGTEVATTRIQDRIQNSNNLNELRSIYMQLQKVSANNNAVNPHVSKLAEMAQLANSKGIEIATREAKRLQARIAKNENLDELKSIYLKISNVKSKLSELVITRNVVAERIHELSKRAILSLADQIINSSKEEDLQLFRAYQDIIPIQYHFALETLMRRSDLKVKYKVTPTRSPIPPKPPKDRIGNSIEHLIKIGNTMVGKVAHLLTHRLFRRFTRRQ